MQLAWHHELERRARAVSGQAAEEADADAPPIVVFPWLVIISTGRPETVLRARGITVPDAARERIVAEKDPDRLDRWLERAAVVASVAEVLGEPS